MKIKQNKKDHYVLLKPIGELDASSAIKMDEAISEAIDQQCYKFLINCNGLSYISSAGVGVFISYLEDVKKHKGKFVFYNMKEGVYDVFVTLGLHNIFTISSSKEDAKKKIHAR